MHSCEHCKSFPKDLLRVPSTPGAEIFIVKAALDFKTCFSDEGRVGVDGKVYLGLNKQRSIPEKIWGSSSFSPRSRFLARTVTQVGKWSFLRMISRLEKLRKR